MREMRTLCRWLGDWLNRIFGVSGVAEPPSSSEEPPPSRFDAPSLRATVSRLLPCGLAVDPAERNLFYVSLEGLLVCRSLLSGVIQWQVKATGHLLCVTDEILWVLQKNAIAAFAIADGQQLLCVPIRLPHGHSGQFSWTGGAIAGETLAQNTVFYCDLSQQTVQLYLHATVSTSMGVNSPPIESSAAYEINVTTGDVISILGMQHSGRGPQYSTPYHRLLEQNSVEQAYPALPAEHLTAINGLGSYASAQMDMVWLSIQPYCVHRLLQEIVLRVVTPQPPYLERWQVVLATRSLEPRPMPC